MQTQSNSPFSLLAAELIRRIFEMLDSKTNLTAQAVCRDWRGMSYEAKQLRVMWAAPRRPAVDSVLVVATLHFTKLRRMDLRRCYVASRAALDALCGSQSLLARMEAMDLEGLPNLTDAAVASVARLAPGLRELSVSKCAGLSPDALESIADGCPELRCLDISYNSEMVPVSAPGVDWPPASLSRLHSINLRGCNNLTPDLLESLLTTCRQLKLLVTPTGISDVDLQVIGNFCPGIEVLDVSYSYFITDNGMRTLTSNCHQLRCLNLEGCQLLTGDAVSSLAETSSELRLLNANYCLQVNDDAIVKLAERCPMLETLQLVGLYLVTPKALQTISRKCPALVRIDLTECCSIKDDARDDFRDERPLVAMESISHEQEGVFPGAISSFVEETV